MVYLIIDSIHVNEQLQQILSVILGTPREWNKTPAFAVVIADAESMLPTNTEMTWTSTKYQFCFVF